MIFLCGLFLNIIWFYSSTYLEKGLLNRTFVVTLLGYMGLFSFIYSVLYSGFFTFSVFLKTILYMIFVCFGLVFLYFLLLYFALNYILLYGILIILYVIFMAFILPNLNFIKLNFTFIIYQIIIGIATILLRVYLLNSIQSYDYGVQFFLSIWLLFVSIYLFINYKLFKKRGLARSH